MVHKNYVILKLLRHWLNIPGLGPIHISSDIILASSINVTTSEMCLLETSMDIRPHRSQLACFRLVRGVVPSVCVLVTPYGN